jgi:hypothetical protein
VDHIDVLSIHWMTGGGNDCGDQTRWDLSKPANLRYITKRDNIARQSGSFVGWVGKGFVSTYAEGGASNAKKIDGQPFLDAPNGKPI